MLREMIREFAQPMMDADVEVRCNAGYGDVSPDRVSSRNGYRRREWDTRAGTIELAIPKLRPGRTSRRSWSAGHGNNSGDTVHETGLPHPVGVPGGRDGQLRPEVQSSQPN
jgi:mutator family transposase